MKLKKFYFWVALFGFLLCSCSDSDEEQPVVCPVYPAYPITMEYTQEYKIVDFKIYVGSPEGGRDISESFDNPEKLWGERLTKYNHPEKIVFRSTDSISHLPHNVDSDNYKYKWSADSLFGYNPHADLWVLNGFGDSDSFGYAMSFHKMTLVDQSVFLGRIGQSHGVTGYNDYFHENTILTPQKMTDVRDTIAWCNVRYYYK